MSAHPENRKQLQEIERKSWQLWMLSLAISNFLAFGIALLLYPSLRNDIHTLQLPRENLPQLVGGLLLLVFLSGLYTILKQKELNALRNFIIATQLGADVSNADYSYDPLTAVLDRSVLPDVLKNESARSYRTRSPFTAVLFDIEGFRKINAREGNLAGDLLLKELALLLQRTSRQGDIVIRYGPDEFLCLLSGTPYEGAQRFITRVEKAKEHSENLRRVNLDAGISEFSEGKDPEEIVADAQSKLVKAKINS